MINKQEVYKSTFFILIASTDILAYFSNINLKFEVKYNSDINKLLFNILRK
jgi:hypothetical protein